MTTHHHHAIIWIDHREARVFISVRLMSALVIRPDHPTKHIHHKANSIGSGHVAADHAYLHAVRNRSPTPTVLITGPANADTELIKHIHQHDQAR